MVLSEDVPSETLFFINFIRFKLAFFTELVLYFEKKQHIVIYLANPTSLCAIRFLILKRSILAESILLPGDTTKMLIISFFLEYLTQMNYQHKMLSCLYTFHKSFYSMSLDRWCLCRREGYRSH